MKLVEGWRAREMQSSLLRFVQRQGKKETSSNVSDWMSTCILFIVASRYIPTLTLVYT